ncbi:MAG: serine hydrolase [Bacteroidota bacterium]
MRPTRVLLCLLALIAVPVQAQASLNLEALDTYFAEALNDWPVPGFAVAIVQNGEVVFEKGYGVTEVGTSEPVDEHTLFAIASNTKAFTTAALATLVDDDRLSWDDRVRDHLPYFEVYNPYVSSEMRVRDLVSHRSGLGTYSGDLLWYGTEFSAEEVVKRTRFVPQAGPFRASYGYSNLMFVAAGEVIRSVTGRPWDELVQERFIVPLDMNRTVTSTNELAGVANVASPHKPTPGKILPIEWFNWDAMGSAGAIISSVHDMTRWIRLQLEGGTLDGETFFSTDAQHEMWSPQTLIPISRAARARTPSTHVRAYGLGWFLNDYHGRWIVGHGGGYDGMFSRLMLVPEENLGVVILTNSMTGLQTALTNRILNEALGVPISNDTSELAARDAQGRAAFYARIDSTTTPRFATAPPRVPLSAYTGRYSGDLLSDATVDADGEALVLRFDAADHLVADLTPLHHDVFRLDWRETYAWFGSGSAHFLLDAAGEVIELRLDVPNDDFWFYELELVRQR